jgi:MtN3 and saliva related transmembrane protein
MSISPTDAIGWAASAVLIVTLLHQVRVQWRERSTEGVSGWLFIGQLTASVGFLGYSGLIGNPVFVVSNGVLVLTALAGQLVYRRNRRIERSAASGPCSQTST